MKKRISMALALGAGLLLPTLLAAREASAANLAYALSAPLKQANCAGDTDGDCLNNALENELAWIVGPQYFIDNGEQCASAPYLNNGDINGQNGRVDFVQVRPYGAQDVGTWQNAPGAKTVAVTYVFAHFFDCNNSTGSSPHNGDNERVTVFMASTDLQIWVVTGADYYAHSSPLHYFDGPYLAARAAEIGALYPSVAADTNGHGSWPGRVGGDDDCAGSEDDCCGSGDHICIFCPSKDCFYYPSMSQSFSAGKWVWLDTSRNVGEFNFWNRSFLSGSGNDAYFYFNNGHGLNYESLSNSTEFCGWNCNSHPSVGCGTPVRGTSSCTSPMSTKFQNNCITVNGVRRGGC
jgi:hypothetical protein